MSLDEAGCPFKGRVKFRCYNKTKPAKFHIKQFQICEASTGYICGFDIYCGKGKTKSVLNARVLDKDSTVTTKVVMGLLEMTNVLDKGHFIYLDNYYTSYDLLQELAYRQTWAAGTVHKKRKHNLKAVENANLKQNETVCRRNGGILCIKWCDKRNVMVLTSIHEAVHVVTHKRGKDGNFIKEPLAIHDYIMNLRGVDKSDQLIGYYSFLRKSVKWWKKLFVHLISMTILNMHILNKLYGSEKLSHEEYMLYLANYLLRTGLRDCSVTTPSVRQSNTIEIIHNESAQHWHFIEKIPHVK